MRLLFASQVFPAKLEGFLGGFVRFLSTHGWEVSVVSGYLSFPYGIDVPEKVVPCSRQVIDGVEIVRTWQMAPRSSAITARVVSDLCKVFISSLNSIFVERTDVVLVCGPPLTGPLMAKLVAGRHRARLVSMVLDVYPDIAIDGRHVRSSAIIAASRVLERIQYSVSDKIVVPAEGFRRKLLERGVVDSQIEVIPIWHDTVEIKPQPRSLKWLKDHGIPPTKRIAMFSGSLGLVSGAPVVADTAHLLRDRGDIHFVVIGSGGLKAAVENRVLELGLRNVLTLPQQPRIRLPAQLSAADICLVTMGPRHGYTSFPSKMLAYMAAGKPVIASVDMDCDVAREIEEHGFGIAVPPADPRALADAVVELVDDEPRRSRFGKAARKRLETYYAQDIVLEKFEKVLRDVVTGRP